MNWSHFQKDIYHAFDFTQDSLLIEAVAGSGKTRTLEELARIMGEKMPGLRGIMVAFNKSIAVELQSRIDKYGFRNVQAMTLHSAGWAAWRRAGGLDWEPRVDAHKVSGIMREALSYEENKRFGETTRKLVAAAKGTGIVPSGRPVGSSWETQNLVGLVDDRDSNWEELIDHYGLDEEACNISLARKVLTQSIELATETCDFDDMLMLPVISGVPFDQYDVVLVDESQDVSAIQMEMISRMTKPGGRVIAVGDRHQCQPPGTMITLSNGPGNAPTQKPIEEIQEGDQVVSYIRNESRFGRSRAVKKIGSRTHVGEIIAVAAGGKSTRCTPNHKWLVRFNKTAESKWCVYLMNQGRRWRIGSCRLRYGKRGCGPRQRMFTEGADNLWILKVCDTQAQAFARESILAAKYGLPMMVFKAGNNRMKGYQEVIETVFKAVPGQESKAMEVLGDFCLQPDLPHISKKGSNSTSFRLSGRNSFICAACNLLPDVMSVALYPEGTWEPIKISRSNYSGEVYSMEVEKELYIADGLLTHNSIYGFRGAGTTSMDEMKQRFGMRELPLSVTYRCPQAVVEHAKRWVPQIEAREGTEWGYVGLEGTDWAGQCDIALGASLYAIAPESAMAEGITKWRGISDFQPGDAILCRLTRPLVAAAFTLIRARVAGVHVLGRDIGGGLVAIVKKAKSLQAGSLEAFTHWLEDYEHREGERLRRRQKFAQAGLLGDKCDTIRVFIEQLGDTAYVAQLIEEIERLFVDANGGTARMVTLATVHKAKGLEWERVFVLDAGELMPCPWARGGGWEMQQEINCMYIAATRTRRELRYITTGDLR